MTNVIRVRVRVRVGVRLAKINLVCSFYLILTEHCSATARNACGKRLAVHPTTVSDSSAVGTCTVVPGAPNSGL